MKQYWVVCPLVFLAGFVDAVGGGGGLISLPAYLLAGLPVHGAVATNKLSSAMGTAVSTGRFLKNGFVPLRLSLCAAVMALIGSGVGANISLLLPEAVLRGMLLVVLPAVTFYVLRNRDMGENTGTCTERRQFAVAMTAAMVIGMYDGLYGPGTGTFMLLILTGLAHMDLRSAAGTTKVMNLTSNVAALTTFIFHGQVYWSLGLTAAVFSIAGHYTGAGLVTKNGKRVVRPVVLAVLAGLFLKVIWDYSTSLS